MSLTSVNGPIDVLKLIALTLGFGCLGLPSHAKSPEAIETQKVERMVSALKKRPTCESIVLTSNNLSTVLWMHKGELKTSQPLWSSDSRRKLDRLVKRLKVNTKIVEQTFPTQIEYAADPYSTSLNVNKLAQDAINPFKWAGNLQCHRGNAKNKAPLVTRMVASVEATTPSSPVVNGPAALKPSETPLDEMIVAENLASQLKKKNETGNCRSFIVNSKNLTAVMWVEDGQLSSGGFLWSKKARKKLQENLKDLPVVHRDLPRELPTASRFAKDPVQASQVFEKAMAEAFHAAKEKQEFHCGLPL